MSDDKDPFAEPEDADRTIIRPNPGGRRNFQAGPAPGAPAAPPQETSVAQEPLSQSTGVPTEAIPPKGSATEPSVDQGMTGMNKINASAATLFSLISRIRNRAQHMDPDKLRRSVVAEIREFESRALQNGVNAQDVKIARYAICATLDDVVLNTPWGGQSVWAQHSLVGTFHKETVGGDRFYDLLARLEQDPANNIDKLEFLYVCLSLGFEGRLRVEPNGLDKHLQIREGLARIIRAQRGAVERELSPHWQGVDQPHRVLSIWRPLWITAACVAVVMTIAFLTFSWMLNRSSDRVLGQLISLNSGEVATLFRRAPPPPPPPPPSVEQINRVKGFLEAEIADGIVEVFQNQTSITVRLKGSGMFGSGSDRLSAEFQEPLAKVAAALQESSGPVIVVGHSDNVPIRSSRFPNNLRLSLARAEAVMEKLAAEIGDERLTSEGRSFEEPIASNDTAEGRARNRRIEIILLREDSE